MTLVIDININETSYFSATGQIQSWAQAGESRAVYAANVHSVMEGHDILRFRGVLNRADLVAPDGMPLVWMLRLKGIKNQQRTYGPTLMLHVLEMAAREKIPVGFYGTESSTLTTLIARLQTAYPNLLVAYTFSPPFRQLTEQEIIDVRQRITQAGVRILFVSLGCPHQEEWIDAQRGSLPAVMIGVGAAFDFHAGLKPQAPTWMQTFGLEWLFRLGTEPRRLWKRYLYHNPRFVVLAVADLLGLLAKHG